MPKSNLQPSSARTPRRERARTPIFKQLEFIAWVIFIVIQFQPLEILISGYDPSFPDTSASARPTGPYFRLLLVWGAIALLWNRRAILLPYFRANWPMLAFIAMTLFVSLLSGRLLDASHYFLTTYFTLIATPFVTAAFLAPKDYMRAWIYAFVAVCFISIGAVVLLPKIGLVPPSNVPGIGSPGDWRGAFGAKNSLGHVSSVTFALTLLFGRKPLGNVVFWGAALAASGICVILSHSSTGYIIAAALPAFYFAVIYPKGVFKVLSIIATTVATSLALAFHTELVEFALSLVHKTANLSGRTDIWRSVGDMVPEAGLFGHGIGYSSTKDFTDQLMSRFGLAYTHNEMLDLDLNFGIIGALAFVGISVYALVRAWRRSDLSKSQAEARNFLTLFYVAWIISGLTETSAGPLLLFYMTPFFGFLACSTVVNRSPTRSRKSEPRPTGKSPERMRIVDVG